MKAQLSDKNSPLKNSPTHGKRDSFGNLLTPHAPFIIPALNAIKPSGPKGKFIRKRIVLTGERSSEQAEKLYYDNYFGQWQGDSEGEHDPPIESPLPRPPPKKGSKVAINVANPYQPQPLEKPRPPQIQITNENGIQQNPNQKSTFEQGTSPFATRDMKIDGPTEEPATALIQGGFGNNQDIRDTHRTLSRGSYQNSNRGNDGKH